MFLAYMLLASWFAMLSLVAKAADPHDGLERCHLQVSEAQPGKIECFLANSNSVFVCSSGSAEVPTGDCRTKAGLSVECQLRDSGRALWCDVPAPRQPSTEPRRIVITDQSLFAARNNFVASATSTAATEELSLPSENASSASRTASEVGGRVFESDSLPVLSTVDPTRVRGSSALSSAIRVVDPFANLDSGGPAEVPAATKGNPYLNAASKGAVGGLFLGVIVGAVALFKWLFGGSPAIKRAYALHAVDKRKAIQGYMVASREAAALAPLIFPILIVVIVVGSLGWGVYRLLVPRSVDYYLNRFDARMEKIRECAGRDVTKDNECMNAYAANGIFLSGRR
jgi:hypothetical protein